MKNQTANVITASRILFAVLILLSGNEGRAYLWYTLGGLTDAIDGTVARKFQCVSEFGAKLDTLSDTLFFLAAMIYFAPRLELSPLLWGIILVLGGIKLFGMIQDRVYHRNPEHIHSALNRITGIICFVIPYSHLAGMGTVFTILGLLGACVSTCADWQERKNVQMMISAEPPPKVLDDSLL